MNPRSKKFTGLGFEALEHRIALTANFVRHDVNPTVGTQSIVPADIDGDGDVDLLVSSVREFSVAWFENLDGRGSFGSDPIPLATNMPSRLVLAADIDGDQDLDVVISRSSGPDARRLSWFEHLDGKGTFSERPTPIGEGNSRPVLADIDNDGDIDVVSGWQMDSPYKAYQVLWHENVDGSGVFKKHVVRELVDEDTGEQSRVAVGDFDRDGFQDIVAMSRDIEGTITLFRNADGKGNFESGTLIMDDAPVGRSIIAVDLDEDEDLDIVAALWNDFAPIEDRPLCNNNPCRDKVVWFENDGSGDFRSGETLFHTAFTRQIYPVDLNHDGNLDLITVTGQSTTRFSWFENQAGAWVFAADISFGDRETPNYVSTADIDDDGDVDVLGSFRENGISWFESELNDAAVADINGDRSIDFTDFLILSQNFGAVNATFPEGDIDEDGQVSFADFLILSMFFGQTIV